MEAVRAFRLASKKEPTRKKADTPALFAEIRQPKSSYIVIPRHSSEQRKYVPFGYFEPEVILHDSCTALPNATLYHFGVLSSLMHMVWMRQICGRIKSDYRYSSGLVYNNFPWPQLDMSGYTQTVPYVASGLCVREAAARIYWSSYHEGGEPDPVPEPAKVVAARRRACLSGDARKLEDVEDAARAVLGVRSRYPTSALADLYDPLAMPAELAKAHAGLDRAVDRCYRAAPFRSDRERVEFLFALYERLTAPLLPAAGKKRGRGRYGA